ncbi:hypothetical protein GWI33_005798 [Rhynchophorus ferrugineus]|uniref:Uncharacterized protein n=1 Tax=Rhynchophorus ferrugineus TaxID=354439 RepID=A0A834MHR6_RHYFE|nr:hypothetical protein GWI33_005798 [Rhynchophorus ferrugineus]
MSSAEKRKYHKPMMEKRRRTRMNNYMNEIKGLLLEAMNKDPARHPKMEKADILEMAVKYLQNFQRQQMAFAMATDPSVVRRFKTGFNECASEIDRFMDNSNNIDNDVRERVSNHLNQCINSFEQNPLGLPKTGNLSMLPSGNLYASNLHSQNAGDQNNNPRLIPQGLQLIPSRLPTGELALLVPNSSNMPYYQPTSMNRGPSAFDAVSAQRTEFQMSAHSPTEPNVESPKDKPVYSNVCTLFNPKSGHVIEDHQVPQVSSTVEPSGDKIVQPIPLEVKTMKFPIHKPLEKEKKTVEHISVIKKVSEPFGIITNQEERYRQAQQKEDSLYMEENQPASRGIKRGYGEIQGLLTTVTQDSRPNKLIKTSHAAVPSTYVNCSSDSTDDLNPVCSSNVVLNAHRRLEAFCPFERSADVDEQKDNQHNDHERNTDSNDMWRPW